MTERNRMTSKLKIDPARLADGLGNEPFLVQHELATHPLLTLDSIAELADRLPEASIEHNLGTVSEVLPGGEAPKLDLSPGEIVRTVESNRSWMVLKNIEQDPAYKELLEATLSEVSATVEATEGAVRDRQGFIFISAPNSVTPSHLDPEYNFLLQVRGSKEMAVGRYPDTASEDRELERYYSGGHRNMDALPAGAESFPLAPGDGIFVPLHAPHVVRSGPEPSLSLSVTWNTDASRELGILHAFNARLRALRLSPAHPGRRPGVDRAKVGTWSAAGAVARRAKRLRSRQPAA
jgi:hypothetical protein